MSNNHATPPQHAVFSIDFPKSKFPDLIQQTLGEEAQHFDYVNYTTPPEHAPEVDPERQTKALDDFAEKVKALPPGQMTSAVVALDGHTCALNVICDSDGKKHIVVYDSYALLATDLGQETSQDERIQGVFREAKEQLSTFLTGLREKTGSPCVFHANDFRTQEDFGSCHAFAFKVASTLHQEFSGDVQAVLAHLEADGGFYQPFPISRTTPTLRNDCYSQLGGDLSTIEEVTKEYVRAVGASVEQLEAKRLRNSLEYHGGMSQAELDRQERRAGTPPSSDSEEELVSPRRRRGFGGSTAPHMLTGMNMHDQVAVEEAVRRFRDSQAAPSTMPEAEMAAENAVVRRRRPPMGHPTQVDSEPDEQLLQSKREHAAQRMRAEAEIAAEEEVVRRRPPMDPAHPSGSWTAQIDAEAQRERDSSSPSPTGRG